MIYFVVFFPVLAALLLLLLPEEKVSYGSVFATGITLAAMIYSAVTHFGESFTLPVLHLNFTLGGFNCIYGIVVCFMWFISSLLSPQYFHGHHQLKRYFFFFTLGLSSTVGVFLSAELYTTFLFFEMMSLGSYVWVVQEETAEAMDAGRTYLTIAVLGGLVTLMGLFILNHLTGTMMISELREACEHVSDRGALWAAALCIFFGFAAKAGAFPLHIWLPKAHPVAPAPASALLSGVLTKAGIFGILMITANILFENHTWGILLLIIGSITMVLGAGMAVFSNNLKYILACSSLSQIGFITVGISMSCLLSEENALAANGSVLYMINHSLVKLTLFLFAGVVYYSTHHLDLNQIKGFGQGKPWLHAVFLCGACSLAGIPGFCGYLSKTLIHESIVEYAHLSHSAAVTAVEWLFLFSGGLTLAYLLKIYVAIFWTKGTQHRKSWGSPMSRLAVSLAAVTLPVIGLSAHRIAEKIMGLSLSFTAGHHIHEIHYFSLENLKGVAISVVIGTLVYVLFIRKVLLKNGEYREIIPAWLSMERSVYKPALHLLTIVLTFICRTLCDVTDALILFFKRTLLRPVEEKQDHSFSRLVRLIASGNTEEEYQNAANRLETNRDIFSRMTGTLSFALLMTCLGVCVILSIVLLSVFA